MAYPSSGIACTDHPKASRQNSCARASSSAGTSPSDPAPLAALDLPLKILVWDDAGTTRVSYVAPAEIASRYRLSAELAGRLEGIHKLTDALVEW